MLLEAEDPLDEVVDLGAVLGRDALVLLFLAVDDDHGRICQVLVQRVLRVGAVPLYRRSRRTQRG